MNTKETVLAVVDAFDRNDVEGILSHMTDSVEWHMLGDQVIKGKAAMQQFFADSSDMKLIASTKHHVIIDGDTASVDGEVSCKDKNGKIFDMYYCDVYETENGKVKKMITYTINKKK